MRKLEFRFTDKTILIISPQKWGKMYTSKQHYALELSKLGNIVYFLNPPSENIGVNLEIAKTETANLFIINYELPFPYKLRFHIPSFFYALFNKRLKSVVKGINNKIDIVWCFDNNIIYNLNLFNADVKIFHLADNLAKIRPPKTANTANLIFAVSDYLLTPFDKLDKPKYFINHGLSSYFIIKAIKNLKELNNSISGNSRLKFGYVGNLFLSALDINTLYTIVTQNPEIEFHFWGICEMDNRFLNTERNQFIRSLINFENTFFYGEVLPEKLCLEIQKMDGFIVCLDIERDMNKGSNSHKILEYLSTGKVIISNQVSTYDGTGLLEMPSDNKNIEMPDIFRNIINNIDKFNSPALRKSRIEYALENTYEKLLFRIEFIITQFYEK